MMVIIMMTMRRRSKLGPSGVLNPMQPTSPLTPLEPPTPPSSTLLPPLLIWRENVALALSVRNVTQFLPKNSTSSGCTLSAQCRHILGTGELGRIIVEEKMD